MFFLGPVLYSEMHALFSLLDLVLPYLFLSLVCSLASLSDATLGSIVHFQAALNLDSHLYPDILVMGIFPMNGFYLSERHIGVCGLP